MRGQRILPLLSKLFVILLLILFCLLLSCPPEKRPLLKDLLVDYKVHYGLDLAGGSELLYQLDPQKIDPTRNINDVVNETIGVISQRIFESRIVKEPRIQKQGENRILIQLPGLNQIETDLIKREIERLGNLEFRLVASKKIGRGIDEDTKDKNGKSERDRYEIAKNSGTDGFAYYERRLFEKGYKWFLPKNEYSDDKKKQKNEAKLLWIKDGYDFEGKKFKTFFHTFYKARKAIGFELKEEFKNYFGVFTEKYTGEKLAIVFNDRVAAFPNISERIDGDGVLLGFSPDQLSDLMKMLQSGSLEIQPELLNENTIGPSLGEDAIRLGISATILGLIIVIVFMALYYLAAGIIADIALLMNIAIIFAILVVWGETLTLPGIAGIILTIGMSVDANIIIFERIREEKALKENNSFEKNELLDILEKAYGQAFRTILDANITTLITAIILYFMGSGPVKGFAFTLSWGILASFFTAIVVTKLIFRLFIEMGLLTKISMLTLFKNRSKKEEDQLLPINEELSKKKKKSNKKNEDKNNTTHNEEMNTNFIGFTNWMGTANIISLILIIAGMALFFNRGQKNYGLDLKGGVLAQIHLKTPLSSKEVRTRLKDKFEVEVQHIQEDNAKADTKIWKDFLIRLPNLHQDEIDKIKLKMDKIVNQMNEKNVALKGFDSIITRANNDLNNAKREFTQLKGKPSTKENEIQSIREKMKRCNNRINDNRKNVADLSKEVNKLKEKRSELMHEKNKLAGIETLRKEIQKKFTKELAPLPFEKLQRGEGRFSSYHVLAVNLGTPVSQEFLMEKLKANQNLFKQIEIGSKEFGIWLKNKSDDLEKVKNTIQRKLDTVSRLKASSINVSEVKSDLGSIYINIQFEKLAPKYAVESAVDQCNWKNATLKVLDNSKQNLAHFNLFLLLATEKLSISIDELDKIVKENIREKLTNAKYENKTVYFSNPFPRFTQISGLVAKAQKAKAFQAIFLALVLILIYIACRFPTGLVFGSGAVIALAHDVLFTLGAIALCGYLDIVNVEINLPVIAALLTIVGYSLNDTIVIFDRIRENRQKTRDWDSLNRELVAKEFDKSLTQVISRTLLTSITTLIVLVCIFVLNIGTGSVMEGFSFTLIVGVLVGTYSSIFVASSLVLGIEKSKRQY